MEPKGAWKHDWEPFGEPYVVRGADGQNRSDQRYRCRVCGAEIAARYSARIKSRMWRKLGIKTCDIEMIERVHAL